MPGNNQFKAHQFIDAMPGTFGIVTAIARKVGCSWMTAKKYIDSYPTVNQAWRAEREKALDLTETKAIEAINAGDGPMIRYFLSTQGKNRGYTERREITGADGKSFSIKLTEVVVELPDDESVES